MKQVSSAITSFVLITPCLPALPKQKAFSKILLVFLFAGFGLLVSSCQKDELQGGLHKQKQQAKSYNEERGKPQKQDHKNKCVPLKGEFIFYRSTNTGNGTASHMGTITIAEPNNIVTPSGEGFLRITGPAIITAANGDEVYATHTGLIHLLGNGMAEVNGEFTITGGTGRFVGATGTFDVHGLGNLALGTTNLTLEGTICY